MRFPSRRLAISLGSFCVALLVVLLGGAPGGPRASAEDAPRPPADPAMSDPAPPAPGMDDPAGGGGSNNGKDDAKDPDNQDDDDVPKSLDEQIKIAIDKGVAWLKKAQKPDGSYGDITGGELYDPNSKGEPYKHPAGTTALAMYALLKCKVPLEDPCVQKGFAWLRAKWKIPQGAYECSALLLALTATADPFKKVSASESAGEKVKFPAGDWKGWAQKVHDRLLEKRTKARVLGWRYNTEFANAAPNTTTTDLAPGGKQDLSSTQLAALALLAADRCGIPTEGRVWNELITFAIQQQEDEGPECERAVYDRKKKDASAEKPDKERGRYAPPAGSKPPTDHARGFSYIKDKKLRHDEGAATGGMTACGIGVLMISRYVLARHEDEFWKKRDQVPLQRAVYDGCAWLDLHYSPFANPEKTEGRNVYSIYYLYCCERAYDLIGNQLIGKHNWFADMAGELVSKQDESGFWNSGTTLKPEDVLDTCFSLLFLRRSTRGAIPYATVTGGSDDPPVDHRDK